MKCKYCETEMKFQQGVSLDVAPPIDFTIWICHNCLAEYHVSTKEGKRIDEKWIPPPTVDKSINV